LGLSPADLLLEAQQNSVLPQQGAPRLLGFGVFPAMSPTSAQRQSIGSEEPGAAYAADTLDAGVECFANIASSDATMLLSSLKLSFLVFSVAEVHRDSAVGRAQGSRGAGLGSRPTKSRRLEVELGV
jgi:hypothetical protein